MALAALGLVLIAAVPAQWALRGMLSEGGYRCEVTPASRETVPYTDFLERIPPSGYEYDGRESAGCTRPELCWRYHAYLFTTRRVPCDPYVEFGSP